MEIELTRVNEFLLLSLNRPEALNALSFSLIREMGAAFDKIAESDARALLVTGSGQKAFCAGADIKELANRSLMDQKMGAELGQMVFAKLDKLPMPSVAIVNGFAFGGGLELALACTFRLATVTAKMGLPEIKLGLIPGYGGTQRLPRLVGGSRALELVMTGRTVGAEEAERIGLVNRLIKGDPLEEGVAFAREFSSFGLLALSLARDAINRGLSTTLDEGLNIEADLSTLAYQTEDANEGIAAFLEKRKPDFQDR